MGGGSNRPPLVKSSKNDSNLVKRHVLAKIDYCCPLLMHLKLNYYHFWLKKGQKNCGRRGFEPRHRRVPPLDCIWKKLSTQNFLEISKRNPKNGLPRSFLILKGTKSRKISPFRASLE